MKKLFLSIAILTYSIPTFAGIEFYSANNGKGNIEGVLQDYKTISMNLKSSNNSWNNDNIRSISLKSVSAGTIIRLYDSPEGTSGNNGKNDDWVEIIVKKNTPNNLIIEHLEKNENTNPYYRQVFHKKNGLNGKVSRISVHKATGDLTVASKINQKFEESYPWNSKKGQANEFKSQDSNYRVWAPDVSIDSLKNVTLNFKVDHIRGQTNDDHAVVLIEFDSNKNLTNVEYSIQRSNVKVSEIADDLSKVAKTAKNKEAMIAAEITKVATGVFDKATDQWADKGGFQNFKAVVVNASKKAADAVVQTTY